MKKIIVMLSICVSFFFFSCHNKEKIESKSKFISQKDYISDYEKKISYEDSIAKSLENSKIKSTFIFYYKDKNDSVKMTTFSHEKVVLDLKDGILQTKTNCLISFYGKRRFVALTTKYPQIESNVRSFKEIKEIK